MKISDALGKLRGYFGRREPAHPSSAPSTPRSADVDSHESLYAECVRKFEANELASSLDLFAEFLRLTDREGLISQESQPYGLENISSYAEFEPAFKRLLMDKRAQWKSGSMDQPAFLDWLEEHPSAPVSASGKKFLFLIPQYIQNSKAFIEADFKDHLLETAVNAGGQARMIPTDLCSYPGLNWDPEKARLELVKIAEAISDFQPDVVVVDGNYQPTAESLNPEFLNELKAKIGFKVVTFIGDAWGRPWIGPADSWSSCSDIIYHFAPESPLEAECRFPEKLCWDGWLVNERNFFPDPQKDLDISFVGTYTSALRPFWLATATMTADELQLRHQLQPHKREAGIALTIEDYAKVLRRSKMVLNFSSRYASFKMMTGRTWQAMASGVLLLDEENRFTPFYFVPFVHFIPYSTSRELAFVMRFFAGNEVLARQIGDAASSFCRKHYFSEAIWSRLLGRAYSSSI